jgi:4-amino-4-deoxy-L-arabinose transferase-like glycosyltransferase
MQLTAAASRAPGRSLWIAVALLTGVGLLVRLPGLGHGLWADEIRSVMESFRMPFPETLSVFPGDTKHPLYALLAHASLSIFGENPWSVRLPALLFGVTTIPLLYALGTRLTSRAEAVAAAALLTLSYHHIWFSQNASGDGMSAFFAVLTTLLLLRASRADGVRPWIWYGLAAGLGAYTCLAFTFTIMAQFLVVGLASLGWPKGERRIGWRGPLAGFALPAAVAVMLYLPVLSQTTGFVLHQPNPEGMTSPAWAVDGAFPLLGLGFGDAVGIGVVALALAAALGGVGVLSYARQSLRTFLLLGLPAIATLFGALAARRPLYPRVSFLLVGFALLIGVRGTFATAAWLARRLRWSDAGGHRLGASMAALIVVLSGLSVPRNWRLPKQDFVGAMAYIEREASGGDAIAVADVTAEIYGKYYRKPWAALRSVADLEAMRAAAPRGSVSTARGQVWVTYSFPQSLERFDATLAGYLSRECTRDRVRTFLGTVSGGDITVCRLPRT